MCIYKELWFMEVHGGALKCMWWKEVHVHVHVHVHTGPHAGAAPFVLLQLLLLIAYLHLLLLIILLSSMLLFNFVPTTSTAPLTPNTPYLLQLLLHPPSATNNSKFLLLLY